MMKLLTMYLKVHERQFDKINCDANLEVTCYRQTARLQYQPKHKYPYRFTTTSSAAISTGIRIRNYKDGSSYGTEFHSLCANTMHHDG
jgi:hypothetical protein